MNRSIHEKNSKHQTTTTTRSNQLAPPHHAIEVLSIERGQAPGVLAVATVKVGGIVINKVRVCNRGRGTFCNFPSRKLDGTWVDLVEIVSAPLRASVVERLLIAVREMGGAQ